MAMFRVQRVGRRYGDHGAIYREVVLTGMQAGQPMRVVLQLPWDSNAAYAVGDAVELTWTEGEVVALRPETGRETLTSDGSAHIVR